LKSAQIGKTPVTAKPAKAEHSEPRKGKDRPSRYQRHPQNPFRPGSSYGLIFDILATRKDGIGRDELIRLLRKETGKDVKRVAYDLAIILSARESPASARHRSCKDGFWVKREWHHYTLMLP